MCWYLIIHFLNKSERQRQWARHVVNVPIELGTSELTNKRVFGSALVMDRRIDRFDFLFRTPWVNRRKRKKENRSSCRATVSLCPFAVFLFSWFALEQHTAVRLTIILSKTLIIVYVVAQSSSYIYGFLSPYFGPLSLVIVTWWLNSTIDLKCKKWQNEIETEQGRFGHRE